MENKKRQILIVLGFILILVICYKLAIARTLDYRANYKNLQKEAILFENTPKQLSVLRQKETYLDSILKTYRLGDTSIQNSLLTTINTMADTTGVKVVSFNEPHLVQQGELSVKTYGFTLEGNYVDIVNIIYELEQKHRFGEIINLHFDKLKDYRRNKDYLQATVLLKSLY